MSNSVGSTVSSQADYSSVATQPSNQAGLRPTSMNNRPDEFISSKGNKKKSNSGLWIIGGLAAGVAALALFKKDGESLLSLMFRRGDRRPAPHTPSGTTPPAHDPTLIDPLDPSMGAMQDAQMDMFSDLDKLMKGRISWLERRRANKNQKALGEMGYYNEHITRSEAQMDAMTHARDSVERHAHARAKFEAAKVKFAEAQNDILTHGHTHNTRKQYSKAKAKYDQAARTLVAEQTAMKAHMEHVKQMSKNTKGFRYSFT